MPDKHKFQRENLSSKKQWRCACVWGDGL